MESEQEEEYNKTLPLVYSVVIADGEIARTVTEVYGSIGPSVTVAVVVDLPSIPRRGGVPLSAPPGP